jgi:hypothetical protein
VNLIDLERIVRQGAAALAESTRLCWPPVEAIPGSVNALIEANLALHLGHALLHAGFLTCAEAYGQPRRSDLLALHPTGRALVAVELKRFDGQGGAGALQHDLAKLAALQPEAARPGQAALAVETRYGLLAGTTRNKEYARWFTTMEEGSLAPTTALAELHEHLPGDTVWNGYALNDHVDAQGQRQTQWLLYALFQLR